MWSFSKARMICKPPAMHIASRGIKQGRKEKKEEKDLWLLTQERLKYKSCIDQNILRLNWENAWNVLKLNFLEETKSQQKKKKKLFYVKKKNRKQCSPIRDC